MPKAGNNIQPRRPFKGMDYIYQGQFPSSRDYQVLYRVFIQIDTRLDPVEQVDNGELYCECPGWHIKKGDRRTCSHVEKPEMVRALERWKSEQMGTGVTRAVARAARGEPWLPDLRGQWGIPDGDPVYVREAGQDLMLMWGDERTRRVPASERREVALIRQALGRPEETLFFRFDVDPWLAAHPVGARRLAWAPGVGAAVIGGRTVACEAEPAVVAWGDAVMGGLGIEPLEVEGAGPGVPVVALGDLPRALPAREARCADVFGGYWLSETVHITWRERGREQAATTSVADFLRRVGLNPDERYGAFLERLRRLLGVRKVQAAGEQAVGLGDAGSPYHLWTHRTRGGDPIESLTLDAARHTLWFGAADLAARSNDVQDLVYLSFDVDEATGEVRAWLALDTRSPVPLSHPAAEAVLAVGAELAVRMGCPAGGVARVCGRPDWRDVAAEPTLAELAEAANLPQAEEPIWQLTEAGQALLGHAVGVQAFAMQPARDDRPAPEANRLVAESLAGMAALLPEGAPPPALTGDQDGRLDVLDWLLPVQTWLATPAGADAFGPDAALIVSGEVFA
jgi:hypothetical protein